MGNLRFPHATERLITADGGGSHSRRHPAVEDLAARLADELHLRLQVCHFPPGTSQWNEIEHRLFSLITKNWRGRPLTSDQVIVNLIAATTTETGLIVRAAINTKQSETGLEVTQQELASLNITPAKFRNEWNDTIKPRK